MKILLSTALFYPSRLGGPANTLYWLAKALSLNNIQVSVVTTDKHIEPGKIVVDSWSDVAGIRVRYCHSSPLYLFKVLWYTWREMSDSNTIMLCDMFQRQVLPVALMARIRRKSIIWSPRGELFGPAIAGSRIKRWYINIVRRIFGKYAIFHATSKEEKEMIITQIGVDAKVVVIPNYIELPQQLARDQNPANYFLFVGRVCQIKAIDRLVIGLTKSKRFQQSSFKLVIAGPNQNGYQQELEKIIEENDLSSKVEFVGNVFGREKFQLYANAYFSCLVSHSENFGNVVIEALCQGTPVIASTGTPWAILNETGAGFWIDNDPDSLGAVFDEIIEMPNEKYLDFRRAALSLAHQFDVHKNIRNWLNIL